MRAVGRFPIRIVVLLLKPSARLLQLEQPLQERALQVVRPLDGFRQCILGLGRDDQGMMAGGGFPVGAILRRHVADANVWGQSEHAVRVVDQVSSAVEIIRSLR